MHESGNAAWIPAATAGPSRSDWERWLYGGRFFEMAANLEACKAFLFLQPPPSMAVTLGECRLGLEGDYDHVLLQARRDELVV